LERSRLEIKKLRLSVRVAREVMEDQRDRLTKLAAYSRKMKRQRDESRWVAQDRHHALKLIEPTAGDDLLEQQYPWLKVGK